MKFSYEKLKNQLSKEAFESFLNEFSEDKGIQEGIIEQVKQQGIYSSGLETGTEKSSGGFETIVYTQLIFEKIDDDTIDVYFYENAYTNINGAK